jgi:hypothetical protein
VPILESTDVHGVTITPYRHGNAGHVGVSIYHFVRPDTQVSSTATFICTPDQAEAIARVLLDVAAGARELAK